MKKPLKPRSDPKVDILVAGKFAVGDRVRVYTARETITGKVDTISPDGHVGVTEDGFYSQHNDSPFHPKQCRRLLPNPSLPKKEERVERWRIMQTNGLEIFYKDKLIADNNSLAMNRKRFLEIRPGETVIDINEVFLKLTKELGVNHDSLGAEVIRKALKEAT